MNKFFPIGRNNTSFAAFHADFIVDTSEASLKSLTVNSLAAAIHLTFGRSSVCLRLEDLLPFCFRELRLPEENITAFGVDDVASGK